MRSAKSTVSGSPLMMMLFVRSSTPRFSSLTSALPPLPSGSARPPGPSPSAWLCEKMLSSVSRTFSASAYDSATILIVTPSRTETVSMILTSSFRAIMFSAVEVNSTRFTPSPDSPKILIGWVRSSWTGWPSPLVILSFCTCSISVSASSVRPPWLASGRSIL